MTIETQSQLRQVFQVSRSGALCGAKKGDWMRVEQDDAYCDCALPSIGCVFLVVGMTVEFPLVTFLEDGMKANPEVEVPGSLLPQLLQSAPNKMTIFWTLFLSFSEADQTPGRSQVSVTMV